MLRATTPRHRAAKAARYKTTFAMADTIKFANATGINTFHPSRIS
jgi:hypothetical protein